MNSHNSRNPSKREEKAKNNERRWIKGGIIINGFLTLISVLVYWVATEQAGVAIETLEFQKSQWRSDSISQHRKDSITIAIAETSSAINIRNMLSLERSSRIQTSPYISCTLNVTEPLEVGKDFAYEVVIINNGQTPAYNISVGIEHDWGTKTDLRERNFTPVKLYTENFILQPQPNSLIKYRRIDKSIITEQFVENVKSKLWDIQTRIAFKYITKWGSVEKYELEPYVYAIGRNVFMNIFPR